MFGKDIMSLKVEMDVPMFRRGKQQLFSKTNERSDRKSGISAYFNQFTISDRADWRYAQIKIKGPSSATSDEHLKRYKNATFSFIATRGISYLSDIAIDDIMLQARDRT